MEFPREILQRLETAGVVAGFSVNAVEHAVPLCRALLAGGIDAIELTLRTPVGLEALKVICAEVPEMLVGAGTILTPEAALRAREAGAVMERGRAPDRLSRAAHWFSTPLVREIQKSMLNGLITWMV